MNIDSLEEVKIASIHTLLWVLDLCAFIGYDTKSKRRAVLEN